MASCFVYHMCFLSFVIKVRNGAQCPTTSGQRQPDQPGFRAARRLKWRQEPSAPKVGLGHRGPRVVMSTVFMRNLRSCQKSFPSDSILANRVHCRILDPVPFTSHWGIHRRGPQVNTTAGNLDANAVAMQTGQTGELGFPPPTQHTIGVFETGLPQNIQTTMGFPKPIKLHNSWMILATHILGILHIMSIVFPVSWRFIFDNRAEKDIRNP